jgi:hypothetical protein
LVFNQGDIIDLLKERALYFENREERARLVEMDKKIDDYIRHELQSPENEENQFLNRIESMFVIFETDFAQREFMTINDGPKDPLVAQFEEETGLKLEPLEADNPQNIIWEN